MAARLVPRPLPGSRGFRRAATLFLLPLGLAAAESHLALREEALAAYQRRDYVAAREATAAALALQPDSPRYLRQLAALAALTGRPDEAIGYLRRIAALGLAANVDRDPDFASLQGTPAFRAVLAQLAAHRAPQGAAELYAELPGRTGLIEGIAFRERTGEVFLGDVHHRCIWRRDRSGRVERYSAEDEELLGIFGLALDEPRGLLWAAMSAVPEMAGFDRELEGHAALAAFSLASSELVRVVHVPVDGRPHGLGDLAVGADGAVYATDSKSPVIWRLAPDAEELEAWVESPAFGSLQGLVIEDRRLLVADFEHGLFVVSLDARDLRPVAAPAGTTLLGLDGLVATPGGVIAVQNGVDPPRLLRLGFEPGFHALRRVQVVAAGLPDFTDLTLVTTVRDQPLVVAGSGWETLAASRGRIPPAHAVRLFLVPLPAE